VVHSSLSAVVGRHQDVGRRVGRPNTFPLQWRLGGQVVTFQIRRASGADLRTVAELFDGYRQFYGQSTNYPLAEAFLRERFTNHDSVVLLALDPQSGSGLGFVQLYPSFSSLAAQRIWILNDLFVAPAARRRGVGRALLDATRGYGVATGAKRLVL